MSNTELSFASREEDGALNVTVEPVEPVTRRLLVQASRRRIQERRGSGTGAGTQSVNLQRTAHRRQNETISRRTLDEVISKVEHVNLKADRILDLLSHILERQNNNNQGSMAWSGTRGRGRGNGGVNHNHNNNNSSNYH